jgi:hypothetical protein
MPRDADAAVENYDSCIRSLIKAYKDSGCTLDIEQIRMVVSQHPDVEAALLKAGAIACMRAYESRLRNSRPLDDAARTRLDQSRRRTKADIEYCRQHRIHPSELNQHKTRNAIAIVSENAGKAAKYDKVVDLLDNWVVGNMRLGECTKDRLLIEAAKCRTGAADLTSQAEVYARLASHMRDGETVRSSTKRETMLDILLALKTE